MIFAMFFRCLFISFLSSLVHFSSVFRIFIRSCISPLDRKDFHQDRFLINNDQPFDVVFDHRIKEGNATFPLARVEFTLKDFSRNSST